MLANAPVNEGVLSGLAKQVIRHLLFPLAMGFVLAPLFDLLTPEFASAYIHDGVVILGGTVAGIAIALSNMFA